MGRAKNLLLGLLWLGNWLLKNLEDLLIDELLVSLGLVLLNIKSWSGGKFSDTVLGDG